MVMLVRVNDSFYYLPPSCHVDIKRPITVGNMASGGLRATSLTTVTNLDAGQNGSNYHYPRHWLYCVLAAGVCVNIQLINNFSQELRVNYQTGF